MDLIKRIKQKINKEHFHEIPKGINAILTHIQIAENYFEKAQKEKNEHYFTDVIYRTNHAFEGILKEAYECLEEKDASRSSPYEIENYLANNSVLNDRVMELFTNYRTNWRNPSTHDYKLFFNSQEAFLAIVTVSSFINILLDQIIEYQSFKIQKENIKEFISSKKKEIDDYDKLDFISKASEILKSYSKYFMENFNNYFDLPQAELFGSLTGFISAFEPQWEISTEKTIESSKGRITLDIMVVNDNENLIIEVKRNLTRDYSMFFDLTYTVVEQLESIMYNTGINSGIVYYTPAHKDDAILVSMPSLEDKNIREIYTVDDKFLPNEEEFKAYEKQIEEYEKQIEEYQRQIENT